MAVVLFLMLAVLVVTGLKVVVWNDIGSIVMLYDPVIGKLMFYSPIIWAVAFSLWLVAFRYWRLARRKAARKAEADKAKAMQSPKLVPATSAPAVSAPVVAASPVQLPVVSSPVAASVSVLKRAKSAAVAKVAAQSAVVAIRIVGDKMSSSKRKERFAKANYARAKEQLEFEKLKQHVVCGYKSRTGEPLSLAVRGKGKYVLISIQKGRIVHTLLAKNAEEAKQEMLGY